MYFFFGIATIYKQGTINRQNRLYIFGAKIVNMNCKIIVVGDLNAAVNILGHYEQNHIALLTVPLDISSVVNKHNLLTNTRS